MDFSIYGSSTRRVTAPSGRKPFKSCSASIHKAIRKRYHVGFIDYSNLARARWMTERRGIVSWCAKVSVIDPAMPLQRHRP